MVTIEQLAEAALNGESLLLRSLTQDLLHTRPSLSKYPTPQLDDSRLLAAVAKLDELLALPNSLDSRDYSKSCSRCLLNRHVIQKDGWLMNLQRLSVPESAHAQDKCEKVYRRSY